MSKIKRWFDYVKLEINEFINHHSKRITMLICLSLAALSIGMIIGYSGFDEDTYVSMFYKYKTNDFSKSLCAFISIVMSICIVMLSYYAVVKYKLLFIAFGIYFLWIIIIGYNMMCCILLADRFAIMTMIFYILYLVGIIIIISFALIIGYYNSYYLNCNSRNITFMQFLYILILYILYQIVLFGLIFSILIVFV